MAAVSKHEGVLPSSSFETRARPFELCGSSSMRAPQDEDGRERAELRLVAEPFAVIPISRCQTAHLVPAAHFCARGLRLCFTHPEPRGWAERRETFGCCAKHPLGVHITRHARRLARRPASHNAGRSPLGAPPWRFWASGPRFRLLRRPPSYNGGQLPSGSVQRAPRSQVVVPGGRLPGPPEANGYKPPPQDATPRSAFRMSPDDALNERGCESIITASICSQEKYSIRSRRRCHQPSARSRSANLAIGINQFAAACASFPHSSACTRTINLYPPPPG